MEAPTTPPRRRRARRRQRSGLVWPGKLLAVANTAEGWQAVICSENASEVSVVADLVQINALAPREQQAAQDWIAQQEAGATLPADLAKLRTRYLKRTALPDAARARDAKLVLQLLARLAKLEQRIT